MAHSRWVSLLVALGAGLGLIAPAVAQEYPSRQIILVVPFPVGGSTDVLARIIAEPMRATLGQPVIVMNVAGAGSTIGVGRAIQSPPDGHTLSIGNWTSHVGASAVYKVSWNPLTDFEPVSMLTISSLMIVGRTGLPAKDAKEFIAWLKANPDNATAAHVGSGSGAHICQIYFGQKTGTRFRYVPYRGGAPVMADLLANQVDFSCLETSQMLGHLKAGKMRPFMVMSKTRWPPMPEVPTMQEVGAASDAHITFWNGLWAPKGTPAAVVAKVNEAIVKAFADPNVIKRLTELGQEIPPRGELTPASLAAFHKSEIEKWWPLIKAADIKVE